MTHNPELVVMEMGHPSGVTMEESFLSHVFASLLFMEKYLEQSKGIARIKSSELDHLTQQEAILKKMRVVANKLQLANAKKNWLDIIRLLKVFYGLNYIVRPEIISSFVALANNEPRTCFTVSSSVYH